MNRIKFIDTTLRDGQQSLWACGMTTGMMLPALPHMDEAGYEAIEFFVPSAQIKKFIRDLRQNPWDWLKMGTKAIKNTPLRLHGGYKVGISQVPDSVSQLMVKYVIDHGVNAVRLSDWWNDFHHLKEEVDVLKGMGMDVIVNFTYTESPRYTDEYWVTRAKDAAALKPYRICLKDVGGLMTPERVRQLFPKIISAIGDDIELEFHAHCNNGLAPINVLEAVKLGITHIHAAIPPLANGSSQPSIFNVASNLKALGYTPDINIEVLKPVQEHFTYIAKRENLPVGAPFEFDQTLYTHQVPGGMISNFRFQLEKFGMGDRLEETLEEVARVRADLGYPIMVTPLSQFVGSQAGINVIVGERYKQVTDEVIQFALGYWGKEAIEVMNPEVRAKILSSPRAKAFENWGHPQLSLKEVRHKYGENLSDEELMLRVYVDDEAVRIARQAPQPKPYLTSQQPLVQLAQQLTSIKGKRYVSIQKGDLSLKLSASLDSGTK